MPVTAVPGSNSPAEMALSPSAYPAEKPQTGALSDDISLAQFFAIYTLVTILQQFHAIGTSPGMQLLLGATILLNVVSSIVLLLHEKDVPKGTGRTKDTILRRIRNAVQAVSDPGGTGIPASC
ncbi:MAG: hypothetical protein ACLT3Y_03560 [Ruminococcus callidus]